MPAKMVSTKVLLRSPTPLVLLVPSVISVTRILLLRWKTALKG
jgi:hypothetical protein